MLEPQSWRGCRTTYSFAVANGDETFIYYRYQLIHSLVLTENRYSFLPVRRYASAVSAVVVCPSVCPSQPVTIPKRLNTGSRKQRNTIAMGCKISLQNSGDAKCRIR